jgi:hypothetical protein
MPSRHFSAAQDCLKLTPCQTHLPATSISPAPAISATSGAIAQGMAAPCAGGRSFVPTILATSPRRISRFLRPLGLKSAFDFRGTEERVAAICGLAGIAVHSLPIEPTVVAALRARRAGGLPLSSNDAVEVMRESYRN